MIKRFFLTFLGSMAAIWLSLLLFGVIFVTGIVSAVMSSSDKKTTKVGKHSVLVFDMSGEICEIKGTPTVSDIMSGNVTDRRSLGQITAAIYRAAHDSRIDGIYVECNGAVAGIASFQAIDEALRYFASRPDKWIVSYADSYTQGNYYAVSSSTELWLNPLGAVDVHGLSATTMFYTGLLDKLGVKMQVLRVGTFKSAVEPYILKDMSQASRMQQEVYMNSIWNAVKERIAENREVTPDQVNRWADDLLFTMPADSAKAFGAVSAVGYRHQAEKHIAEMVDKEKFADVKTISINDYIAAIDLTDYSYLPDVATARHDSDVIAVLYAEGEISDNGKSGIIGDDMVKEIENLIDDSDRLAGLILRVNSPGGSAFASEQIWEALERFKSETGLPFYVSMGDVAASGGYYISCGADKIFAQSATITGSIGIFGMIPEINGLLTDKLGVNTATVQTNKNGNFPSIITPMTESQRSKMQSYIERGYDTFTKRCAEGRHMSQDSIKMIAEGRVWDGALAQSIGLVDSIGSLHSAILAMAADLGIDKYSVESYPRNQEKWWMELLEMDELVSTTGMDRETLRLMQRLSWLRQAPRVQCRMEDIVIN
ncbi:MAG: signal peptide peptidase SppA [Muribaculaceae bacterium]|nr:signal peptide peptidase SppA [Muribaculaceae bacterium]